MISLQNSTLAATVSGCHVDRSNLACDISQRILTLKYQTSNSEEGDKITSSSPCLMKVKSREIKVDWTFIQSKR